MCLQFHYPASMHAPYRALLENDIQAHQDRVDEVIVAKVRQFKEANHFQIDLIENNCKGRSLVAK